MVNFEYMWCVTDKKWCNRPCTKSTISQKLKVEQKKTRELKNLCQINAHLNLKFGHFFFCTVAHLICHHKL